MDLQEKLTFMIFLGDLFDRIKPKDVWAVADIQDTLEEWLDEACDTFIMENELDDREEYTFIMEGEEDDN